LKPGEAAPSEILVIEADEDLGVMLSFALEQETHQRVLLARDGDEAMHLLEVHAPRLVLVDADLPGMQDLSLYDQLCTQQGCVEIPTLVIGSELAESVVGQRKLIQLGSFFNLWELFTLVLQLVS